MIKIDLDAAKFKNGLLALIKGQLDYATALAMTRTVKDAKAAILLKLPSRFKLRNNFVKNSIRFDAANKTKLRAVVGSRTSTTYNTDFLELQEEGGTKRPKQSKHLAISGKQSGIGGPRGIIRRRQRPSVLLADRANYFKGTIKGTEGIWKRLKGRGKKRKRTGRLKLVYLLTRSGHIDKRFHFIDTATDRMARVWPGHFTQALDDALRTAR